MAFARYHGIVVIASAVLLAWLAATTPASATTHPIAAFVHVGEPKEARGKEEEVLSRRGAAHT